MAKKEGERSERTVTVTFETRDDKEQLEKLALMKGVSASSLAREFLLVGMNGEAVSNSLINIEQHLELLNRNIRGGTWMILRAMDLRAEGKPVTESAEWIRQKMPVTERS